MKFSRYESYYSPDRDEVKYYWVDFDGNRTYVGSRTSSGFTYKSSIGPPPEDDHSTLPAPECKPVKHGRMIRLDL